MVYTYANYKLLFATKKSGAWAIVTIEDDSGATTEYHYGYIKIAHAGLEFLVYCTTSKELFYSDDEGATWSQVAGHDLAPVWPVNLWHIGGQWVLLQDDGACWTSTNRVNWTKSDALALDYYPTYGWETIKDYSARLHMTGDASGTLYHDRTVDSGANWGGQNTLLAGQSAHWGIPAAIGNALIVLTGADSHPSWAVSLDGGATWETPGDINVGALVADLASMWGGSYHLWERVCLKLAGASLYAFCTIATSGANEYGVATFKSTNWMTGAPTWTYPGQFAQTVCVGWEGAGCAHDSTAANSILVWVCPRTIDGALARFLALGIYEADETMAGAGALVYALTPGGTTQQHALEHYLPTAGATIEVFEYAEDPSVKWWEVSGDEGGGYPGSPPFIYVGNVLYE